MSQSRVVVFSCDAMVWEDMEYLLKKPMFKELFEKGSAVRKMRTIYPSVTYPCHTTMMTGCYPGKHGVTNNSEFHPGMLKGVPWNWFSSAVKVPDIFTAAKKAGLTTANAFWPVTGGHEYIDYNLPEYWPQSPDDTKYEAFRRGGTSQKFWDEIVDKHIHGFKIRSHPQTDQFIIDVCCDVLRMYKPHLLMLHTGDVDHYRHKYGVFNEHVTKGVEDTERWFYDLINATREAGTFEETNFFLVSDHGQIDIVRNMKPNVMFARNGLMEINADGTLKDWKAYCHSTGMSAQIRLKDPADTETWQKTYDLLKFMRDEGIYGIGEVLTAEEAAERDHLYGDFSFVIHTDGYSSFSEDWKSPMVAPMDLTDYRFGRATHGYYPDLGPQPVFFGFGPDIRSGVILERRETVDEAPTYAKILGVEMPGVDGHAIDEILK